MKITDGVGTNRAAEVDSQNRLSTKAVSISERANATVEANSYNLNSGLITLTTAGESGVLYLKNNDLRDLHIDAIIVILGPSTGGAATDTTQIVFYKNPTTGTLISAATDADVKSNRNFGSSITLTADLFKGAEGVTITDGTAHIESLISPGNRVVFTIDEILTKGDSLAVSLEPNNSNTSMKVMAAITCHIAD